MKRRIVISLLIIICLVIFACGCSSTYRQETDKLKTELLQLEARLKEQGLQLDRLKQQNEYYEEDIKSLTYKLNKSELEAEYLYARLAEADRAIVQLEKSVYKDSAVLLPLYTTDVNTDERIIESYVVIPKEKELHEKLELVAHKLSIIHFRSLPIELARIDEKDGKKIAVVNLRESEGYKAYPDTDYSRASWAVMYFQGSAGGSQTAAALIDTFLQKDYKGKWVDGVQFLYENETINFEHVGDLSEIHYR